MLLHVKRKVVIEAVFFNTYNDLLKFATNNKYLLKEDNNGKYTIYWEDKDFLGDDVIVYDNISIGDVYIKDTELYIDKIIDRVTFNKLYEIIDNSI